jgi:hypothetical protein
VLRRDRQRDSERYVADFYRAFAALDCRPADLGLFDRNVADLRAFVLDQDIVYVGAATRPACSPSGARTASTRSSRKRGRPASSCAASAPA